MFVHSLSQYFFLSMNCLFSMMLFRHLSIYLTLQYFTSVLYLLKVSNDSSLFSSYKQKIPVAEKFMTLMSIQMRMLSVRNKTQ